MSTSTTGAQASAGGPAGSGGRQFAGFWIRAGAYLIDGIVLWIVSFVIGFIAGLMVGGEETAAVIGALLTLVIGIAYFTLFTASEWQATPGKRLLGIYVIQDDGGPIAAPRAFGRYWAYLVSWIILLIGFIMVAFTEQKTALHDMICRTRVVYGRP
jgi:uncharacterized RDD family membrane protein YckC